jgi:hypothetical protein
MSQNEVLLQGNPGRQIQTVVNGIMYVRYPIKTRIITIDDNLEQVTKEYVKDYLPGDIIGIVSKIVSICNGFYVHESKLKITWLSKFLVRFVKKWPNDPGYANPKKIQLAMDIVGLPRFILAMFGGGLMKLIGKPGYFYRIAGHNINAIDGFSSQLYPKPLDEYGFLLPDNPDAICNELEVRTGMQNVMLDSNDRDTHVLGVSAGVKNRFSTEEIKQLFSGNPQGQDDGTPYIIVKKQM